MHDLITLQEAAQRTGNNPSTLRGWILKDVIPGAVEIESRGKAGGRRGYYPTTIIPEIETAKRLQEAGLTLETIARARTLALELMAEPEHIAGAEAIAKTGPAARQWLTMYSEITGDPVAREALRRLEAEFTAFLTLFVRNLRENMSDVIGQIVVENPNNI